MKQYNNRLSETVISNLFPDKVRPCRFAELWRVFKSLIRKAAKVMGRGETVGKDVSQHRATA